MTKTCSVCKIEKDIIYFSKNGKARDGLSYRCSDCNKLHMRSYHASHPKERKAYDRAYNLSHTEERRAYCQANKEKIQAYLKEYKARNRDHLKEMERIRKLKIQARLKKKQQMDKNLETEDGQLKLIDD